MFNKVLTYLLT